MPLILGEPSSTLGGAVASLGSVVTLGVDARADIFFGGAFGYVERIKTLGTFVQLINVRDDLSRNMQVNGLTVNGRTGDVYAALAPIGYDRDWTPHDIVWLPDNTGYLTITGRTNDTVVLRKYSLEGTLIHEWAGLDHDFTWNHFRILRIDVACDSKTVFYTDQSLTIFRFDISTGMQLTPFHVLAEDISFQTYIYGAFKLLRSGGSGDMLVIGMSDAAPGPQQALCLDADRATCWIDMGGEDGPLFHARKIRLSDHTDVLAVVTRLTAGSVSKPVTALACWVNACPFPRRGWVMVLE